MKSVRVVVGLSALLSVGAVTVLMWPIKTEPSDEQSSSTGWHDGASTGNVDDRNSSDPPYYKLTVSESNELAHLFLEITDAYTNSPVSVLREKFAMMPDFITNVTDSVYSGVRHPLYVLFGKGFVFAQNIPDFNDAREFTDFADRNLAVARFIGDIEIKRGANSGYLVRLERSALWMFTHCREKFRNEGNTELVAMADRYIREWCEHIESEKSFTRSYARFQVALQMSGGKTREQAIRFARSLTWGKGASYTPKWLDEEFPLLEESSAEK